MRRLMLIALLCLLAASVNAQDGLSEQSYRLRQPTAEDYANILPQLDIAWASDLNSLGTKIRNDILTSAVNESFHVANPNLHQVDVNTLKTVHDWLRQMPYSVYSFEWIEALVVAHIQQNLLDLTQSDTIEILEYTVNISHYDYDKDGTDEALLQIETQYSSPIFIILDETGNVIRLPLPWYCGDCSYIGRSGRITLVTVQDVNNDGIVEWVFSTTEQDVWYVVRSRLIILQWNDHEFVNVSSPNMVYEYNGTLRDPMSDNVEVIFDNVNADDYTDVITIAKRFDTWECENYLTTEFIWNPQTHQYDPFDNRIELTDSANCALRQGQAAMWDYDYERAILFFEQAIEKFRVGFGNPKATYVAVRLALAYMMTGQSENARTTLANFYRANDEPIDELASKAYSIAQNRQSSLEFCFELYNVFDRYNKMINAYPYWGRTYEYYYPYTLLGTFGPAPNTRQAGCDAPYHLAELLDDKRFYVTETPLEIFSAIELPVKADVSSDLNQDGYLDWLVWFNLERSTPTLFLSGNTVYNIINTDINFLEPSSYTHWYSITLPDGQPAFVSIFWDDVHTAYDIRVERWGAGGVGKQSYCTASNGEYLSNQFVGNVQIFTLNGSSLNPIFEAPLCDDITLDALFADQDMMVLSAWFDRQVDTEDYPLLPTQYVWNGETYISDESQNTPPLSDLTHQPELQRQHNISLFLPGIPTETEYELVIERTSLFLQEPLVTPLIQYENLIALHHRAFAYERLGMTEEALADYVTLYTEAPDTAWGMLAGLHIEPLGE